MKKIIFIGTTLIAFAILLSVNINILDTQEKDFDFHIKENVEAASGYKMETTDCPGGGGTYNRYMPKKWSLCSVSRQTWCM